MNPNAVEALVRAWERERVLCGVNRGAFRVSLDVVLQGIEERDHRQGYRLCEVLTALRVFSGTPDLVDR